MAISGRQALIFGAGLALGIGGAWLLLNEQRAPSATPATDARSASGPEVPGRPAAPASTSGAGTDKAASGAVGSRGAACPAQTTTALSDAQDGQFKLQADVSGKSEKDIAAFIVVGKEAAASGRARDAEVAFLMSCRVAEQHKGAGSLQAADAKYQLAWHYANLSLQGKGGTNRPELLRRAELLYTDSLEIYRAGHGPGHEKTRFASEGLAALRQPAAEPRRPAAAEAPRPAPVTAAAAPAPEPPAAARSQAPAPAAPPQVAARTQPKPVAPVPPTATARVPTPPPVARRQPDPPATRQPPAQATMGAASQAQGSAGVPVDRAPAQPPRMAAAQGSATATTGAGEPIRPSFDCGKARSPAERIICSDAELARQDRDLGRLYARARDAAPDAAAFRRHNEREWRRREATCRDRECLLRWYDERRQQLRDELSQAGQ